MPLPPVNNNLANVSMDYFLRGAEAAKPQGAPPAAPGQAEAEAPQAPQGAGKLVSQLDILLLKAAKASTTSLDGKTVKQSLRKLVDDGALDRASLKLLQKSADTAAKTLKALDKFTGRQLAEAFDAEGRFDATATKAGKAVAAAVRAQQDLSDLLAQLGKNLDRLSRHDAEMRQAYADFKGVDAAVRDAVDEFRSLSDRRATEIDRLARQMKDFAVHLAANGRNADPNVAAILEAKAGELLPRQALAMHGTADALATVNEEIAGKLRPVAEKIDAFRRNPATTLDSRAYAELESDIRTMQEAVTDIRKNGVAVAGGRMVVPRDIVKALEEEVSKARTLFETARKEVVKTVLSNAVETAETLLCMANPDEEAGFARTSDERFRVLEARNEMFTAMRALRDAALDPAVGDLNPFLKTFSEANKKLTKAAYAAELVPGFSGEAFNAMLRRCRNSGLIAVGVAQTMHQLRGSDRFFTGAEAMRVFEGELSVSSIVEARARGLRDEDVDPANEDANIVSERKLGSGAAGSVFELERRDGTLVVFKGEAESRSGLGTIAAGGGEAYDACQKAVDLNFATKKAAEALGMGGLVVDYSAGVHKGVFGFYMEKAKGVSGRAFGEGKAPAASDGGLSPKEIRKLPAAERRRVQGEIRRQLNRLQWLDLVTGQNDRHWENYFVHVDRTTREVSVKGIDNDAGYSQSRVGAVKYAFDKSQTVTFKKLVGELATKIDSRHAAAVRDRLLADPGLSVGEDGYIVVDATKLSEKALGDLVAKLTGTHSLVVPDKIDRAAYDALVALKQGPAREAYLASIRPRLSPAGYDAAVSRLDDVIAHAEKLAAGNGIVEENGWGDVEHAPLGTGRIAVRKHGGGEKRLDREVSETVHELFCPSYFARDRIGTYL